MGDILRASSPLTSSRPMQASRSRGMSLNSSWTLPQEQSRAWGAKENRETSVNVLRPFSEMEKPASLNKFLWRQQGARYEEGKHPTRFGPYTFHRTTMLYAFPWRYTDIRLSSSRFFVSSHQLALASSRMLVSQCWFELSSEMWQTWHSRFLFPGIAAYLYFLASLTNRHGLYRLD